MGPRPSQCKILLNVHSLSLLLLVFFKSTLLHKNWRDGGELFVKSVQWMVTPTNHVIARAGFTLCWALALWDIRNIFLPNTGEDQKKF